MGCPSPRGGDGQARGRGPAVSGPRLVSPEEIEQPVKIPWWFNAADVRLKFNKPYPSLEGWWTNRPREKKAGGLPHGCSIPAKRGSLVGEAGFHVCLLLRRLRPPVLAQRHLIRIRDSRCAAFSSKGNTRGRASFKLSGRSCPGAGKGPIWILFADRQHSRRIISITRSKL